MSPAALADPVVQAIGPGQVQGLPAHVLLVHLAVVSVPVAALATVLSAAWPAARRRLRAATPLAALAALVVVPVTVSAGEWLAARIPATPRLARHERLGDGLLPWVAALAAVAVLEHLWFRRATRSAEGATAYAPAPHPAAGAGGTATLQRAVGAPAAPAGGSGAAVAVVATVLALVAATGSVVQVYRIGDSGARAVWEGTLTSVSTTTTTTSGAPAGG